MTAGLLQFAALYFLAAAMPRHREPLLGRWQRIVSARRATIAGWVLLAVSSGLALTAGDPIAVVSWLGLLPLSCGLILLGLSFSERLLHGAIMVAALCICGLMFRPAG